MRPILIILFFMLMIISAKLQAQKWLPGHFTDVKGNVEAGFIRINPSPKGPIKDEGFIEFKENEKASPFKLSASDLKSFVVSKDSFIVAHAPANENWAKHELDFIKVALGDDIIKVYVAGSGTGGGGGGGKRGVGFEPGISTGIGTGGYGAGIGGGISIPIGGGGGGGEYEKSSWYYGENTADMKHITNENFEDVMSDIMGDYPEVVEKIHAKVYMLANIDRLIVYFKQVQAAKK